MWGLRFDATDLLMARTDFRLDDHSATVGAALEVLPERVMNRAGNLGGSNP
jgi:hypothetical protein